MCIRIDNYFVEERFAINLRLLIANLKFQQNRQKPSLGFLSANYSTCKFPLRGRSSW